MLISTAAKFKSRFLLNSQQPMEDVVLFKNSDLGWPTVWKRLVTSRNLRAMNSANFEADVKSFTETAADQCADPKKTVSSKVGSPLTKRTKAQRQLY